ncbi:MAG: lipid-A-disaccharide synthase [Nitrospirota bacterium]
MSREKKIMIIAGEASGDLHGGKLASALKRLRPDTDIFGMGGQMMREAGVRTLQDISTLAVVGIWEVLTHFKDIKTAFRLMEDTITNERPDVLVLIDYPDFNLRMAGKARKAGVKVVYYVSPQVWAWRRGRIKHIAKVVDRMLVVFPFEEALYNEAGVKCSFVGHPLMDEEAETRPKAELADKFGLDPQKPVIGLLPGSRKKELHFHLPVMLKSLSLIKDKMPEVQAVIPVAPTLSLEDFKDYIKGCEEVRLIRDDVSGVMSLMDAGIVASGTATLQTALRQKPMVIIYRLSPFTYWLGKMLIDVPFIGMPNLVAGKETVPELIQHDASPDRISSLILKMFYDKAYYGSIVRDLGEVRRKLGGPGASERAAVEVLKEAGI